MFTCTLFWSFNGKVISKPFWNVIMLWWVQKANNHWIAIFFSANWGTVIDSSLQLVKIYFSLILVLKGTGHYTMKIPRIFDKHFFTPITFHSFEIFYIFFSILISSFHWFSLVFLKFTSFGCGEGVVFVTSDEALCDVHEFCVFVFWFHAN